MKALVLLAVGLMSCSACTFAGEYLMNDTGETVTGLRVVFSEPVRITSFGDVLLSVDPPVESLEFVFSGGELEAWEGHWLNWEPSTVQIGNHEWTSQAPTARSAAETASQDVLLSTVLPLPGDQDGDSLPDDVEVMTGTNTHEIDTDGDGLSDYDEVTKYLTNPLEPDSDGDGVPDSDWKERREYTDTISIVATIMQPYDLSTMTYHYQDVREISDNGLWLQYEAVIYPNSYSLLTPAPYPRSDLPDKHFDQYLKPTTLLNYSPEMQDEVREIVSGCTTDLKALESLIAWKARNVGLVYYSGRVGTPFHYRFTVRPGVIEASRQSNWFAADREEPDEVLIPRNMLGDYMFKHRAHGSCYSAAIFNATILRAAGIPARIRVEVPLWDKYRDEGIVQEINDPELKAWILSNPFSAHFTVDAFMGNQWIRVDTYEYWLKYGENGIPYVTIGAFPDAESTALGLAAETWGSEGIGWGDNPHSAYQTLSISSNKPTNTPSRDSFSEGIVSKEGNAISCDGIPGSEWDGIRPAWRDQVGETREPGADIESVYVRSDDAFLYCRIDVVGGLAAPERIMYSIYIESPEWPQGSRYALQNTNVGPTLYSHLDGTLRPLAMGINKVFEVAVPLDWISTPNLIRVNAETRPTGGSWNDRYDDTGWWTVDLDDSGD